VAYDIPLAKMGQGEMQQMCGGIENLDEWIDTLRTWTARTEMPMHHRMRLQALIETSHERMAAVETINRAIAASEIGKCNDAMQDMLSILGGQ